MECVLWRSNYTTRDGSDGMFSIDPGMKGRGLAKNYSNSR